MPEVDANENDDPFIFKYGGIYFPSTHTSPQIIDSVQDFEIRDSDVFLITYPKSGTVWTQQILSLIVNEGHRNGTEEIQNMSRVPWIEYNLSKMDYDSRPSPRLFSSHLPYYFVPRDLRNKRGKIIYIARNPKDVAVSYYHFYKAIKKVKQKKDWETFLDDYLSGKVLSSSWFDHVKGWYTHQEDFNILFLTYEEMKKDLRSSVRQICRFVEKELDEREVDTIVEKATFQNMKQDPLANYTTVPEDTLDVKIATHLRKGTVGDWKNLMTVAQNEKFDKIYSEKMIGVPINFTWDISEGN
ncbi:hypothetical protein XENTR_v10014056 [Xenopus tropicalis]|nr:amine sulfotransferase [Xenopus tropicalis]KAE8602621.1 hypothetical protein XENTR_v10014056 [Xenopus tropicalis]|eukprot:XP_002938336.1 PREDICTED: amine sulfotransferase-like [Xenopus tropicalis]